MDTKNPRPPLNRRPPAPRPGKPSGKTTSRQRLLILLAAVVFLGVLGGFVLYRTRQKLSAHYDTLVVNGTVVDGTGAPGRAGTIGIRAGRVVEVEWASFATADRVIDATGMIVAPGFIDVHTHIERNVENLSRPLAAENFLTQGFTTLVTGNCGRSAQSLAQFFGRLEQAGTSVNVASLVGHNTVRRQVMGDASRAPSADELSRMKSLVERAMGDGALGFSTGLEYEPGMFSALSEIEALAGVAGRHRGIYATHMRDEGNGVLQSVREAIEVARKANVPLEISHLKARGRTNWGSARALLDLLKSAEQEGLRVTCDAYPYTASSTTLDLLLPKEAREGGSARLRERLRNPAERRRIVDGVIAQMRGEGWQDFSFARVAYFHYDKELNGLTIPEIASRLDASRLRQIPSPSAPVASPSNDAYVVSGAGEDDEPPPAAKPQAAPSKPVPADTPEPAPASEGAAGQQQKEPDAKKFEASPAAPQQPAPRPPTAEPQKDVKPAEGKPSKEEKPASPRPSPSGVKETTPRSFVRLQAAVQTRGARLARGSRAGDGGAAREDDAAVADPVRAQAEAVCWMAAHGGAQMIFENMSDADVSEIMSFGGCMIGSDSGVRTVGEGRPHPRGFGSAPRYLGHFVRDTKLFTLEEAVRRMTSLPAETFGIAERGKLHPGHWADVVVFDRERVKDLASYDDPFRAPEGIAYVLVNGEVAYERGRSKNPSAGRVIRRQGS